MYVYTHEIDASLWTATSVCVYECVSVRTRVRVRVYVCKSTRRVLLAKHTQRVRTSRENTYLAILFRARTTTQLKHPRFLFIHAYIFTHAHTHTHERAHTDTHMHTHIYINIVTACHIIQKQLKIHNEVLCMCI